MHYARASRKLRGAGGASGKSRPVRPHIQRCAVRVTYLSNRTRGQWQAHGRYLARESATEKKTAATGFNRERDGIDIVRELEKWQSAGDARLWKVILSPEFGDRIDLRRLARDLVGQMEKDLGTDLEWIAVTHHNTEHPHAHMVIRGVTGAGEPLHFKREYVKHGIRAIAEEMCTQQLGYRTSRDAAEAERREIGERRFTSLDRALLRNAEKDALEPAAPYFTIMMDLAQPRHNESARHHVNHVISRLAVLERMGLAESAGPNTWHIRPDLEEVLRAMQRTSDWQKVLAAHGVPISDKRLPLQAFDLRQVTVVEGRILVHGEDEQSARRYLMLEGTDAKVHFIYCTAEMEGARSKGELRTNSFVRLSRVLVGGKPIVDIHDFGDADQVLKNRALLGESARAFLKRGVVPTEDGWGGWLGKFQAALASTAREIVQSRELGTDRSQQRKRDRSRGR
jgi:type IV secretory pathway VirD2 relaxase